MASMEKVGEKLSEIQDSYSKVSKKFEGINNIEKGSNIKEGFLKTEIRPKDPGKVAGVDGGLLKKRYSAGDLVATRAVSAIFDFSSDKISASYIPSKNPDIDFKLYEQEDSRSLERNAENDRLIKETKASLKSLGSAEHVLMDGSIVPSYLEEDEAIESYRKLFRRADYGQLAGVVEDSHGLKMANMLEERLDVDIGKVRDTLLMDQILNPGERSFVRRYSDSPVEHPVLQKLDDKTANRINTFYLKLSSKDIPLRIDFYGSVDHVDDIAGKLINLKSSDRYTVPSPIVEADRRAKIPEKVVKRMERKYSLKSRRRDRRVF